MQIFGFTITIARADNSLTSRSIKKTLARFAIKNCLTNSVHSKIELIKKHREITGCMLKESKNAIEEMFGYDLENLKSKPS